MDGLFAICSWILALLLGGCATTTAPVVTNPIGPYPAPHGRILLLGKHRAQLLFRCAPSAEGGSCRFTHAASGRIVELRWRGDQIWQRSNSRDHQAWAPVARDALDEMGMVVTPATMMGLLSGTIPSWLHPKGSNRWQGRHHHATIALRWYPDQQRLEITNRSKGAQIRLLLAR